MGPGQLGLPFVDGLRCVGSAGGVGTRRFPVRNAGPAGALVEGPGIVAYTVANFGPASAIGAGQSWNFQAWFRDPAAGGAFFDLSDGLSVTFTP